MGGKDKTVKIFDEATKEVKQTLLCGDGERKGHSNRVFCAKYLSEVEMVTGGWDSNIFLWDLRMSRVARQFHGPHICGDSIDVKGDMLLAGNHALQEQIIFYSMSEGRKMDTMTLPGDSPCMPYTAQFSKSDFGSVFVVAGEGSGETGNETHFYTSANKTKFAEFTNMPRAVYSADFANNRNYLAVGSGDGSIRVFNVK